tara:strand:+ start:550 stop:1509 length:960 start_codon:yes stop_codon:yes gene_type:complete
MKRIFCALFLSLAAWTASLAKELKLGMIGLDTSHVVAFTKILNDPKAKGHVKGAKVIAAFKGGSPDVKASYERIDRFTKTLVESYGVKLYPTIEQLCEQVDAVLLESVDGRPHLTQARPVILAGKPLFIDKPLAGSFKDAVEIYRLAAKHKVPVFSSSSLRWGRGSQAVRNGSIGKVTHCQTHSPCSIEPHHPDLYWYGIHGVESLFTVMGTGCKTVRRGKTPDGLIEVTGTWAGGRTGVFREGKGYGGEAKGEKGTAPVGGYDGYAPMIADVVKFFQTGVPPVTPRETLEIYAFMTAADESKRQDGKTVPLPEIPDFR